MFFFSPFIVGCWGFGNLRHFPEVIIFRIFVGVPTFVQHAGVGTIALVMSEFFQSITKKYQKF